MATKKAAPPTKAQHAHANKITHREASGKFKEPPHQQGKIAPKDPSVGNKKLKPAELDQDAEWETRGCTK